MLLDVEKLNGELILVTGVVNSGKTEDLIETVGKLMHSRYAKDFMVFTNSRNTRDGTRRVVSTSGLSLDHVYVADAERPISIHEAIAHIDIGRTTKIVIFDEGNLHTHKFVPVVKRLMDENRVVLVYGLDLDFRGKTFGPMGKLEEIAKTRENITGKKLIFRQRSYCKVLGKDGSQCSKVASYTLRLVKNGPVAETAYFDTESNLVRGFTKAPYYGATIIVEGSRSDIKYTTACSECFGELPGRKLVEELLACVQQGGRNGTDYKDISARFKDNKLAEVLAYCIEERKIDIYGGTYAVNTNGSHPTWEEAAQLAILGKELDEQRKNSVLEVYRFVKENTFARREDLKDRFGDFSGLERTLSGLIAANFLRLENARLLITPYVEDTASGMYVPADVI